MTFSTPPPAPVPDPEATYRAFLLRFWRDGATGPWRITLRDPHTHVQRSFASLPHLLAFLRAEFEPPEP